MDVTLPYSGRSLGRGENFGYLNAEMVDFCQLSGAKLKLHDFSRLCNIPRLPLIIGTMFLRPLYYSLYNRNMLQ